MYSLSGRDNGHSPTTPRCVDCWTDNHGHNCVDACWDLSSHNSNTASSSSMLDDLSGIKGTCEKQCNLSGCSKLPMPDDVEDCDLPCDKEWCDGAGERLCPLAVSYQCSVGSAAYGCSDDSLEWTMRTSSATCSLCCKNTDLC